MFRASQCSSSGDRIVLIHHLVWLVCVGDCLVCRSVGNVVFFFRQEGHRLQVVDFWQLSAAGALTRLRLPPYSLYVGCVDTGADIGRVEKIIYPQPISNPNSTVLNPTVKPLHKQRYRGFLCYPFDKKWGNKEIWRELQFNRLMGGNCCAV